MIDLPAFWFILVGILFAGYAMLDGFDLGVGSLHLFTKEDEERRILLNAIGPVWDGNEVWLVTGGGALFAAFPEVYATVFSGFYDAFMLLLLALIFRAVAIEVRSKEAARWWRRAWDCGFAIGSMLASFLIGVAMGNIVWGVPLDANREFTGTFLTLVHPYAVLLGLTTMALFAMHGNIYLIMKTEGALQAKLSRWIKITIPLFVLLFILLNIASLTFAEHIVSRVKERPLLLGIFFILTLLSVFNVPRLIHAGKSFRAFLFSCFSMGFMMILFGLTMFPVMVFSSPEIANSLTIYNSASSDKTLGFMMWIAIVGVPIVLVYMACVYYIFRGKVTLTEESY